MQYDKSNKCQICGEEGASTKYCDGVAWNSLCHAAGFSKKDHLHRICKNCSYEWIEKPKKEQ